MSDHDRGSAAPRRARGLPWSFGRRNPGAHRPSEGARARRRRARGRPRRDVRGRSRSWVSPGSARARCSTQPRGRPSDSRPCAPSGRSPSATSRTQGCSPWCARCRTTWEDFPAHRREPFEAVLTTDSGGRRGVRRLRRVSSPSSQPRPSGGRCSCWWTTSSGSTTRRVMRSASSSGGSEQTASRSSSRHAPTAWASSRASWRRSWISRRSTTSSAAAILAAAAASLDGTARSAVLAAAHGNPLALLELPHRLSVEQREGREPLPPALVAGALVESAFAQTAAGLPTSLPDGPCARRSPRRRRHQTCSRPRPHGSASRSPTSSLQRLRV